MGNGRAGGSLVWARVEWPLLAPTTQHQAFKCAIGTEGARGSRGRCTRLIIERACADSSVGMGRLKRDDVDGEHNRPGAGAGAVRGCV